MTLTLTVTLTLTLTQVFLSLHRSHTTSLRSKRQFDVMVTEVRRNRLWLDDDKLTIYGPGAARRPKLKRLVSTKWHRDLSIWYPRKTEGNSKDYYETEKATRRMFLVDWDVAHRSHGLAGLIEKLHGLKLADADADRNSTHDEVDAVREALLQYRHTLYGAWDYYTTIIENPRDEFGEVEMFSMDRAAWT